MNQITAEKIARYQLAFRESLKVTADSDMDWPKRKAVANKCAAQISPSVAEAMSVIMIWRRKEKAVMPNAEIPISSGEYYLINRALAWKTKQKKKHDTPKVVAPTNSKPSPTIVGPIGATGVRFKKGYICDWYEQWFLDNDTIHAKDKELAFALGCSPGAFTNARNKMRKKGFEIELLNGSWVIAARPVDERKQAQIDEIQEYLDLLGREVVEAKEKLAILGV